MNNAAKSNKLDLFDVTNLVVGSAIGADIYIVGALGSGFLGPASLVAWVVAGVIAIIIALNFAECAALIPHVGGAYAYACEAWGTLPAFSSAGDFGSLRSLHLRLCLSLLCDISPSLSPLSRGCRAP